jgi:hypothetical protein
MRTLVSVAILAALLGSAPARADDRQLAAEHFQLAEAAEKRGDWAAAIEEYKAAYDAKPHPSVLYNIARDYERLEDWERAAEYYQRYLDEADSPSDRDKVEAKLVDLRRRAAAVRPAARPGSGVLVVHANVDGAQVRVDDVAVGATPFSGAVPAGPHRVTVTADGHKPVERQVAVSAAGTEEIFARLEPTGAARPQTPEEERARLNLIVGVDFGYSIGTGTSNVGYRLMGFLGARFFDRVEVVAGYGLPGGEDKALEVGARYYLRGGAGRPYVHAGASWGSHVSAPTDPALDKTIWGVEAGGGILIAPTPRQQGPYRSAQPTFLQYYVEADLRMAYDTGDSSASITFPIFLGILMRI